MRTLQGKVSRIRHTIEVTGNRARTRTTHIAIFEIDGVRITFGSPDPVSVERGDEVRVVSYDDDDEIDIDAIAYHNLSRDIWEEAVGRGGCAANLGCVGGPGVIGIMAAAVIAAENPFRVLADTIPAWVPLVALVLLWIAIRSDRRRNAEREEVLQTLFA